MSAASRLLLAFAASLLFVGCTTPGQPGGSSPAAVAEDWQEVVKSDTQQVFIDVSSLARNGDVVQAAAKTNFAAPMMTSKNAPYLSAKNVYRLDCVQRKVALKEINAYAEADLQGKRVQKATFYENNLQWMDAPQDSVFAHMIDFGCQRG
jgi:hypothetical protein